MSAFKHFIILILTCFSFSSYKAQLSGVYNIPSSFPTLASALSAINTQSLNGPVTFNITSGHTEIVPIGGLELQASGSSINTITIQKNGTGLNPILYAYSNGTATPSSPTQDGIFRLVGADYVIIDGINFIDLNTSNPSTMEYGLGLFKKDSTDGCQNIEVKNCFISLNKNNNAASILPSMNGSRGIVLANSTHNAATTSLTIGAPSGTNSNNKFYNNSIQNCNIAIALVGYKDVNPYSNSDQNNDIGGATILTGNRIENFGGAVPCINPAYGIYSLNQNNLNISNNYINNNNGLGYKHTKTIKAISTTSFTGTNLSINNNSITIITDTALTIRGIENVLGTTNTINISNNVIENFQYNSTTGHDLKYIENNGNCDNLDINNNIIRNNSTSGTAGTYFMIYNTGVANSIMNINLNSITNNTLNVSLPITSLGLVAIFSTTAGNFTQSTISNNSFINQVFQTINTNYTTGGVTFIANSGNSSSGSSTINNNIIGGMNIPSTNMFHFINNNNSSRTINIIGNYNTGPIVINNSSALSNFYGIKSQNASNTGTVIVSGNKINNITVSGSCNFEGIGVSNNNHLQEISTNTITQINAGTGAVYGIVSTGGLLGSMDKNNYISDFFGESIIFGMYESGYSGSYKTAISNTISSIKSSSNNRIGGIFLSGGEVNITKNKIYNIESTGTSSCSVNGITFDIASVSPSITISNNIIGDLRTPFANTPPMSISVIGINIAGMNSGGSINVYNNSVYLNCSSVGSNFSSTCLFHLANPNPTFCPLVLKNNILINKSIPNGSGVTSAFSRSSNGFLNYSTSSDKNIFYADVPGPNNLIYFDLASGYQTLTSYQAAVAPRDANSFTEDSPFLGTIGNFPNFLHLNPSVFSNAESGASNLSGIIDDIDNDIRQGNIGYSGTGTAPDIGADEYNLSSTPCNTPGTSSISPISSNNCTNKQSAFTSTTTASGTGIVFQWQIANNPGGPYSNVTGGSGINSAAYLTNTLSPGIYYFVMTTTCLTNSIMSVSNEATLTINPLPLVSVSASTLTVCTNSIVTLNGMGALTYTWNNGVTNGVPFAPTVTKSYTVTGTDVNGCTNSASVNVNVVPSNGAVIFGPNTLCIGNSTILSGSSFNPGTYTVNWSTGATNTQTISVSPTSTTVYTITLTNSFGCIASYSKTLTVISLPTLSISSSNSISCSGKTSTVSIAGATSYTWNTGATTNSIVVSPTISTTYSVLGTGTGSCVNSASIAINVIPIHTLSILGADTICNGSNTNLTASIIPTGIYNYTWSTGANTSGIIVSPSLTTSYTLTSMDSYGCSSTKSITINVVSPPSLSIIVSNSIICLSQTSTISASGATSYSWSTGSNQPFIIISPTITTNYYVIGSNLQGCTDSVSITQFVTPCTYITNSINDNGIEIYPNPSQDYFYLKVPKLSIIKVYSISGQLLSEEVNTNDLNIIDLSKNAPGMYFVHVAFSDRTSVFKIIKN